MSVLNPLSKSPRFFRGDVLSGARWGAVLALAATAAWAQDDAGTGLIGSYYANEYTAGAPVVVRTDARIAFVWGAGAPDAAVPVDGFSVVWDGEIVPRFSEVYTLTTRTDDGARVWIDDQLVIDDWNLHGVKNVTGTFTAVAGRHHRIRVAMFERTGSAAATLSWQSASQALEVVPSSQLYPVPSPVVPVGTGTGLLGRYFAHPYAAGTPVLTRTDAQISFDWAGGSPDPTVPADDFAVLWEGEIQPRFTEDYTLIAKTDDGARVWIDDQLVIDDWNLHGVKDVTGVFHAEAGKRYRIKMATFEHRGSAVAKLWWNSSREVPQPVPSSQLYPVAGPALPTGSGMGLIGTYFAHPYAAGTSAVTRTDAQVNFDWAGGSPDPAVPADDFAVLWEGEIQPRFTEDYTLITKTDDGVRVWIDDQLVIDDWNLHGVKDVTGVFHAEAGKRYRIKMATFEHLGSAVAQLWWQSAHELPQPVPSTQLYPVPGPAVPTGTGTGLVGSYFANETLAGAPALIRTDAQVFFDWDGGAPDATLPADRFSVRWEGFIEPRYTEDYILTTRTDDGARVWVDGQLVIDDWKLHGVKNVTGVIHAVAGQRQRIRMEMFEHLGSAVAQLWWQSAHELFQPVPGSQLYAALPPTVSAVVVTPAPVTGRTATVAAAAADDLGAASLTYTWSSDDATVTFAPNGTSAAAHATATFTHAGTSTLTCTVTDASGRTANGSTTVTVVATPTALTVTPASTWVAPGSTTTFSAAMTDQFGAPLASQPGSVVWSISDSQTISITGAFTAPSTAGGPYTVTATAGGTTGTAQVWSDAAPVITAAASVSANPVTGTTVGLDVTATDDGGASLLTYTWSVVGTPPYPVSLTTDPIPASGHNAARFTGPGVYHLQVVVADRAGATATSAVDVSVVATATTLAVMPTSLTAPPASAQAFIAVVQDQFGASLASQPTPTWSLSGGGTITQTGMVTTSSATGGPYTVTASTTVASKSLTGTAALTVSAAAPVAQGQHVTVPSTGGAITLAATAANGSALTWTIDTSPAHGTLSGTAPTLTYTPNAGFVGADAFTFQVASGAQVSNVATVAITVVDATTVPMVQVSSTPLVRADAFDAWRWSNDSTYRTAYLANPQPGRVWQPAEPGPGVPLLTASTPRRVVLASGAAGSIGVVTAPGCPVTAVSFGTATVGGMAEQVVTLVADATTGALTIPVAAGRVGSSTIRVASPGVAGTLTFVIAVAP